MRPYSKMHRRANYFLVGSAVLFALVWLGSFWEQAFWYEALYWASQSALIGSVADWFAVSALFRKPLGIPFHTALIPRNRDRLIQGVIGLVETKLLTKDRCHQLVGSLSFVPIIEKYMESGRAHQILVSLFEQGLSLLWQTRSHEEWGTWGAYKIRQALLGRSLVPILRHVLLDLCEHNRYEAMVIEIIGHVQAHVGHPALRAWLAGVLREETQKKKKNIISDLLISFSEASDVINYEDMAEAIIEEAYKTLEGWKRPGSPERIAWLRQWVNPVKSLHENKEVCHTLDQAWARWIQEQDWEGLIETYVAPHIDQILQEGANKEEAPAQLLAHLVQELWKRYGQDQHIRSDLEETIHHIADHVLDQAYGLLGVIIRHVLEGLSGQKFVDFIESKVEDDLAWIRINGALVGGLCGFLLWSLLQLAEMVVM